MADNNEIKRRDFLKFLAVGSLAAGGLKLARRTSASETGGSSPYKWVMVIDQARCKGCGLRAAICPEEAPQLQMDEATDVVGVLTARIRSRTEIGL